MPTINSPLDPVSGAVIDILVGVDWPRQDRLRKHGFKIPETRRIRAQLDTGSALTAVDPTVLATLDPKAIGKEEIITPSTGATPHECDTYFVSISFSDPVTQHHPTVAVIESV